MRDPVSSSNPYAILGLEAGATMAEVKRAYRRLAKAYHPDSAGEAAVPRFLAIHAAYESIRTGRPMAAAHRGPGAATEAREPWRADPDRAKAARERARRGTAARSGGAGRQGAGSSGTSGTPGSAGPSARAGATGTSGTATDGPSSTGSTPPGSTPPGSTPPGATGATGRRGGRRHVRKATMGSTSYDDARDPNDATWSGASWYGPSTGEYWIVNPREYADPRKHGPEYQSRARRTSAPADAAEPDEVASTAETTDFDGGARDFDARGSAAAGTGRGGVRDHASAAGAFAPRPEAGTKEPVRQFRPGAERPRRSDWATPPDPAPGAEAWAAGTTQAAIRARRGPQAFPSSPRDRLGSPADDPIRRLGIALVAWPPLGLATAAVIGQVTGCSAYSAACDGTEPLLPWLAQAGILGLLLLLPPAARVLAGGTIGILFALLPITAFLVSVGGSGAPQAGFALAFFLAVAWLAGVAWSGTASLRRQRAGGAP